MPTNTVNAPINPLTPFLCRYGEFVVLPQHDHINVCKPTDRQDPAYSRLADFLRARLAEVRQEVRAVPHILAVVVSLYRRKL